MSTLRISPPSSNGPSPASTSGTADSSASRYRLALSDPNAGSPLKCHVWLAPHHHEGVIARAVRIEPTDLLSHSATGVPASLTVPVRRNVPGIRTTTFDAGSAVAVLRSQDDLTRFTGRRAAVRRDRQHLAIGRSPGRCARDVARGPVRELAYDRVLRSPAGRQPKGPVDPDALKDRLRRRLVLNWRGCGGRFAARHGWSGEERRRECRDRALEDDDPRACQLVNADVSTAA